MDMKRIMTLGLALVLLLALGPAAHASDELYGDSGRFVLPSQSFSVALYDGVAADAQTVTDREASAAWLEIGHTKVVADHCNQGFDAIKTLGAGELAYIEQADGTQSWYKLMLTVIAVNTGTALLTAEGENLIARQNEDELLTYTCNSDGTVTVVLWTRTEAPKLE